jgi:hypothetical protein
MIVYLDCFKGGFKPPSYIRQKDGRAPDKEKGTGPNFQGIGYIMIPLEVRRCPFFLIGRFLKIKSKIPPII